MKSLSLTSLTQKIFVLLITLITLIILTIGYLYYLLTMNSVSLSQSVESEFIHVESLVENILDSNKSCLKHIVAALQKNEDSTIGYEVVDVALNDDCIANYVALLNIKDNKIKRFNIETEIDNVFFAGGKKDYYRDDFSIPSLTQILDKNNYHIADLYYEMPVMKILDMIARFAPNGMYFRLVKNDTQIVQSFKSANTLINLNNEVCKKIPITSSQYALHICKSAPKFFAKTTNIVLLAVIITIMMICFLMHFIYKNIFLSLIRLSRLEKIDDGLCSIVEMNKIVKLITMYSDQIDTLRKKNHSSYPNENLDNTKFEFLSCVTHELRDPVNAIINFADLINKKDKEKAYSDYVKIMQDSAKNLLLIIDNIIEVANIRLGVSYINKSKVNIFKLIEAVIKSHIAKIEEKKISIRYDVALDLPEIFVDGNKMYRALTNIIGNAIKFSDYAADVVISLLYDQERGKVSLFVKDTGFGIPKEKFKQTFQEFSQLDNSLSRKFSGIGVGLFVARAFIQMNDGLIEIFSTEGNGTSIKVELPAE